MKNQPLLLVVAGAMLLIAAVFYAWRLWGGGGAATPGALVRQALSHGDPVMREEAAVALVSHPQATIEHFRQVWNNSDDEQVRAAAAIGLGVQRDWESIPSLIDALESPSPLVRGRSGQAVQRITGHDASFHANGPEPQRLAAIADWQRRWPDLHEGYLAKQRLLATGKLPRGWDEPESGGETEEEIERGRNGE